MDTVTDELRLARVPQSGSGLSEAAPLGNIELRTLVVAGSPFFVLTTPICADLKSLVGRSALLSIGIGGVGRGVVAVPPASNSSEEAGVGGRTRGRPRFSG